MTEADVKLPLTKKKKHQTHRQRRARQRTATLHFTVGCTRDEKAWDCRSKLLLRTYIGATGSLFPTNQTPTTIKNSKKSHKQEAKALSPQEGIEVSNFADDVDGLLEEGHHVSRNTSAFRNVLRFPHQLPRQVFLVQRRHQLVLHAHVCGRYKMFGRYKASPVRESGPLPVHLASSPTLLLIAQV